jgi:hypothetical protein
MNLMFAVAGLAALAACQKPADPKATASPGAAASGSASTAPSTAPASGTFAVGYLKESDSVGIQGCSTMLSRKGAAPDAGDIFDAEGGEAANSKGFIRIDGAVVPLTLVSATYDEKGGSGVRVFTDAGKTLTVTETLKTGKAHEASDSVEQSGTLVVVFKGETQTIEVEGGTAC